MDDLISRETAIEMVKNIIDGSAGAKAWTILARLKTLPSVQLEQLWVPCKECKPEKSGEYWVTLIDEEGFFTDMVYWNETAGGRWEAVFVDDDGYSEIGNVIAWMPLPEPYMEDDHETD